MFCSEMLKHRNAQVKFLRTGTIPSLHSDWDASFMFNAVTKKGESFFVQSQPRYKSLHESRESQSRERE